MALNLRVHPSLSKVPEIFSYNTPNDQDKMDLETAIGIVKNDSSIDPFVKHHIITMILRKDLPDAGYLARNILRIHSTTDNDEYTYVLDEAGHNPASAKAKSSVLSFVEMFIAGTNVLRAFNRENYPYAPNLEKRASNRLGPLCELTGAHGPSANLQSVRILPYVVDNKLNNNPGQKHLWEFLSCFWSADIVEKIKATCTKPSKNSRLNGYRNNILMSSVCRKAYDNLEFYLFPVPGTLTLTEYDVEIRWAYPPYLKEQMPNDFREAPTITDEFVLEYPRLEHGYSITFKTVDPVLYPLPDPGLLWVRAFLTCMALPIEHAIREGAVWGEEVDDYAEDDTYSEGTPDDCELETLEVSDWLNHTITPPGSALSAIVEE